LFGNSNGLEIQGTIQDLRYTIDGTLQPTELLRIFLWFLQEASTTTYTYALTNVESNYTTLFDTIMDKVQL
jgi:hypothetical protein